MKTDVVVIGGGPAGSTCAMYLAREGIRSIIVEKSHFPRYHVGESMTGEAGVVLRDLGLETVMLNQHYPRKTGTKVYGTGGLSTWYVPVRGRDAQNNLFDQFTWQVRRSDFDVMMLQEAVARGSTLIHGQAIKPIRAEDGSVHGVEVRLNDGGLLTIEADMLLDCSGQATFLANAGVTGPKYLGSYDKQIAIFSQVTGCLRDQGDAGEQNGNNTLIFYESKFHWAWFIPLDDDVVSVGVVAPANYFLDKKENKRDYMARELHEISPELKRRLPEINFVEDVHVVPNYSFQVKDFCGKGFACVGDAHRFIDPIFSLGLYVTLKEAQMVAPLVREYLNGERRDKANPFADFQLHCEKGIDVIEDMIDLFWEQPFAFALLVYRYFPEELVDAFAGRIYHQDTPKSIETFRRMLKRERKYDDHDLYSVPIGSRFHPERAPLWQPDSLVEGTEAWIYSR